MKPNLIAIASIAIAIACALVACGSSQQGTGSQGPAGGVSLTVVTPTVAQKNAAPSAIRELIVLPDGDSLNTVTYSMTGPASYNGTADITNAPDFDIAPVQPGSGYTLSISGTTTMGAACSGTSASFTVAAGVVTPVSIAVTCALASDGGEGAVSVTATVTVGCPTINWAVASNSDPTVGVTNDTTFTADVTGRSLVTAMFWNGGPDGLLNNAVWVDASDFASTYTCQTAGVKTMNANIQATGCPTVTVPVSVTCH